MALTGMLVISTTIAGAQTPAAWDSAYTRFSEAYRTLNPAMVANLYATDGWYIQQGDSVRRGRPAIQQIFERYFSSSRQRGDSLRISFEFMDRAVDGSVGYDIGWYILKSWGVGRPARESRGKFIVLWKRARDGAWTMHADMGMN